MLCRYARALSISLLTAVAVRAANVQIRDLPTTIVLPASNQYFISDGGTQGTGKMNAVNFPQVVTTRTTLAALSVVNVPTGVTVQTLGGSALGDSQGSLYYYSSTSTATANGVTVISPGSGVGRWLIVFSNSLPSPTTTSLGGIFSKAAVPSQFVTQIGTDGVVATGAVNASDVVGLGTMSLQPANNVAITGGTISGLTTPLPVASGGTGGNSAASARTALGAADATVILNKTLNLSDLSSATSARVNLGLGSLATQSGTFSGTSSGTNTGDQTITLTGAITGSGTGAITTSFGAGAITNANLANVPTLTLKGRNVAGSGVPSDLTAAQAKGLLAITNSDVSGLGGAALLNVGTAAGTVAAGNDSRFVPSGGVTGATLQKSSAANYSMTWQAPLLINVKNYGALGDGTTDDRGAINSAITALTSHSTLYFPPGKYRITGQLNGFASLSYVTMTGDGAEIYNDSGASGANTIGFDNACSHIEVCGLRFTGTATVRGNGIHIRSSASFVNIHDNYFAGCSDFAVHISGGPSAYCSHVIFADNNVYGPIGDGVHVGSATDVSITGNAFANTGDDGIAVISDYTAYPPNRVTIVGNAVFAAGGLASSVSGTGIRVEEANDVFVSSNNIYSTWESGIEVGRYTSTTARNVRISVNDNKIYNSSTGGSGPRGSIWINFCDQSNVTNNQIIDPNFGAGIAILDCNDLSVTNNFLRGIPFRGIVFDDSTTTNVATNWTQIAITNNILDWVKAGEAIYAVPASGKTLTGLMIAGNNAFIVGGNWIYYDRATTGRVFNNTNTSGATVAAGGSVSGVTFGNNN